MKNNNESEKTEKNSWEFLFDFQSFFNDMITEMYRHYSNNGDSWKTCDIGWIKTLMIDSMEEYLDNPENVNHLIDVANFIAMYHIRYDSSKQKMIDNERT